MRTLGRALLALASVLSFLLTTEPARADTQWSGTLTQAIDHVPVAINDGRYIKDWVTAKFRWGLSQDSAEKAALEDAAAGCTNSSISVTIVG